MTANTVACSTEDYEVVVLCLCESGRNVAPSQSCERHATGCPPSHCAETWGFQGPVVSPAARPYLFAYDASSQLCRGEERQLAVHAGDRLSVMRRLDFAGDKLPSSLEASVDLYLGPARERTSSGRPGTSEKCQFQSMLSGVRPLSKRKFLSTTF